MRGSRKRLRPEMPGKREFRRRRARARQRVAAELPALRLRSLIAESVHRAVCAVEGTDGNGKCGLYAVAGADLAKGLTGRHYFLQAGKLSVPTGHEDLHYTLDPDNDPNLRHAWFAFKHRNCIELVDLASRHIETQAGQTKRAWKHKNWPKYIWDFEFNLRGIACYEARAETLESLMDSMDIDQTHTTEVIRVARVFVKNPNSDVYVMPRPTDK